MERREASRGLVIWFQNDFQFPVCRRMAKEQQLSPRMEEKRMASDRRKFKFLTNPPHKSVPTTCIHEKTMDMSESK